jgi:hypothetical protein
MTSYFKMDILCGSPERVYNELVVEISAENTASTAAIFTGLA